MPGKMIKLTCPVCGEPYEKNAYEHKRNVSLGRTSVCSRTCHASYMNQTETKLKQNREMLAERNAHQYREDNPNWKGGISAKSHPLKPLPEPKPDEPEDEKKGG